MRREDVHEFSEGRYRAHKLGLILPVRRLLQLLIVKILTQRPMRAVDIKNAIKDRFEFEVPNAIIYMVLKGLEERGLIYSKWDKDLEGNPIKVYFITEEGRVYLSERTKVLQSVKRVFEFLTG